MSVIEGDIRFTLFENLGYADITLAENGRDLEADAGFETAILILLFTNLRVIDEELLPGEYTDRSGWWGHEFLDFPMGSKLWLLQRSKNNKEVLVLAKQYAEEALQHLIDEGIASEIVVNVSIVGTNTLSFNISCYKQSILEPERFTYKYYFNWVSQVLRRG